MNIGDKVYLKTINNSTIGEIVNWHDNLYVIAVALGTGYKWSETVGALCGGQVRGDFCTDKLLKLQSNCWITNKYELSLYEI